MNRRRESFQLEKTVPGAFLLQGLTGGALGAFIYLTLLCLYTGADVSNSGRVGMLLLFVLVCMCLVGGTLGVIKATIMWGIYRVTGFQMTVLPRVAMTMLIGSIIGCMTIMSDQPLTLNDASSFVWPVSVVWLTTLPAALFVGSRVKPWALFTFGSIAVDHGRVSSKSLPAILSTLPLRLLSLAALGIWILTFAGYWTHNQRPSTQFILMFLIPASYFGLSAYLSFRSPRKQVLLAIGLLVNAPVVYLAVESYINYSTAYWFAGLLLVFSAICSAFLLAWALFLVARLTARTHIAVHHVLSPLSELGHHCLGSRFMEWHEHAA